MMNDIQSHRFYYSYRKDIDRVCREAAFHFRYSLKYEHSLTLDDLYQEAVMQVLIKSSRYDANKGKVSSFIHDPAFNAVIDALRRHGNYIDDTIMEEPAENIMPIATKKDHCIPTVDSEAFSDESQVQELMKCLSNDRRTAVELKFGINCYCEHSDEDIASELGLSRPTVKKEINLALEQMRQYAKKMESNMAA